MQFNPSNVERMTALTNVPLTITSLVAVLCLWRWRRSHLWAMATWIGVFGGLAVASALGAVVHGLDLDASARQIL